MLFQGLARKVAAAFRERYPWFGGGSFKVTSYRSYLDNIADVLSKKRSLPIRTRFNKRDRCVELYARDKVLLQVRVSGGVFFDGDMYVDGKLSGEEQRLFDKIPLRMHFRTG